MTTLYDLLSRGYFPKELPPLFYSEDYATKILSGSVTLPSDFTSKRSKKKAKLISHNLARTGNLRRKLSVPNPVIQYGLAKAISDHWSDIVAHTSVSALSKSNPVPGPSSGRAVITEYGHDLLPVFRLWTRATSRYILRTDISKFYPSIYTHSIPWALHTKPVAKKKRGDMTLLGNILDKWVRAGQDQQTIGIPIGPDSSLIIAEILLSAFDKEFEGRLGAQRGFRHVDDFELGFPTIGKAEEALAVIQELLAEYELTLNNVKTQIIELPDSLERPWVAPLRNFQFPNTVKGQARALMEYFDKAFRFFKEYPDEYVLKYAIARLRGIDVEKKNWEFFLHFLLQVVTLDPGTFVAVLNHIIKYKDIGYTIDLDALSEVIHQIIVRHGIMGHGNEVAWAIWTSMIFELQIEKNAAAVISRMSDSIVALLALDAHNRGLIPDLDVSLWSDLMETEELYGTNWLLVYEASVKGWLPSKSVSDHVEGDDNFKLLKDLEIEFYRSPDSISAYAASLVPTFATFSRGIAPSFSVSEISESASDIPEEQEAFWEELSEIDKMTISEDTAND